MYQPFTTSELNPNPFICVPFENYIFSLFQDSISKHLKKEIQGSDFMYFFLEEMYKQKPTYTRKLTLYIF